MKPFYLCAKISELYNHRRERTGVEVSRDISTVVGNLSSSFNFFFALVPSVTAAAMASGVRMVVSPAHSPDGSPVPL